MPTVTTDQGLSLPVDADVADNPVAFSNFVTGVEPRLVRLYTDAADRTTRQLVVAENELSGLATENRVEVYNGTTNVSLHARAVFGNTRVAADQTLTASSTVLQNVTNMAIALPTGISGAIIQWYCRIFYDASAAADIKFAFTIPAGVSMRWGLNSLGTGGTNPSPYATTNVSGTALPAGALGVGTGLWAIIQGELTMGATAGNLQLQAAQNTSDASATVILARTYMEAWRVS